MAGTRVVLKISGIRKIIKGPEVTSELARRSKRIAAAAGEGFEAVIKPGRYTARAFVQTITQKAAKREAEAKVLTRALDAGR